MLQSHLKFAIGIVVCALMWLGANSWGFDDESDTQKVTQGILPEFPPSDLDQFAFEDLAGELPESWKSWTQEAHQRIAAVYKGAPTAEGQATAIHNARIKVETLDQALGDPAYRSIYPQLRNLRDRLQRRLDLAEAVLKTITVDPQVARERKLNSAYAELRQAARNLRQDLESIQGGRAWFSWCQLETLVDLQPSATSPEIVSSVRSKLEHREDHPEEITQFLSRESFLGLEDALMAIEKVANQDTAAQTEELRNALADLVETLEKYYAEPTQELALEVRRQFDMVRGLAPDGGHHLEVAMRRHFLNYNLYLYASEGLLNRFASQQRQDASWVNECIMGARVTGHQCTLTDARLNLQPNTRAAQFQLVVNGHVKANTTGVATEMGTTATVRTVGNHSFHATKSIDFDGQQFGLSPTQVSVSANNQTVGVSTDKSWIPILGRIVDNVAYRKAQEARPKANAITRQKISSEVKRSLDEESQKRFSEASMSIQSELYGPLRKNGLYPDVIRTSSTSEAVAIRARLMHSGEIGGSHPPQLAIPSTGMVAHVHETMITNGADEIGLEGKTMTEQETRDFLEKRMKEIFGDKLSLKGQVIDAKEEKSEEVESDQNAKFVFDDQEAIRVQIREGEITLQIRTGLIPENGDPIPTQIITVPFKPILSGDVINLERGTIRVTPLERVRPNQRFEQIARAGVMRNVIGRSLPEQSLKAEFPVEQEGKKITMQITDIIAANGWLSVTMQ